jgi:DNA-binding beta-propeller fold protein YncE
MTATKATTAITAALELAALVAALALGLARPARADAVSLIPAGSAYADARGDALRAPEGVACTDQGAVVVADTGNHRLVLMSFKENALQPGIPIKLPELGSPSRVQIDSHGDVLSLDRGARRIARIGAGATFMGYVTPTGVPGPLGITAFKVGPADSLVLLDGPGARVVVLDAAGAFVRALPLPAKSMITDVAVDTDGTLLLVDAQSKSVFAAKPLATEFTPFSQSLGETLSFPGYLAPAPRGLYYLIDVNGQGLVVLSHEGKFAGRQLSIGWTEGLVYYPQQICVDAKGDVLVADRNNNRVQAFAPAK